MSLFSRVAQLDQKFSWSFFGFLLAVIFGLITVYTEFIKKNAPDLNFEIVSNANVLDVHESVGNLEILYKGSSLNRNSQSLRILVLKVVNDGDQAILPSYYDPDDPVGFRILNGQIVERPRILEAGSPYLREHVKISQISPEAVTFTRVILEPGDFFTTKVLVLHGNAEEPRVVPIGKVAGVKRISLTRQDKNEDRLSFVQVAFFGSLWVQIARSVLYFIASFGLLIAVLVSSISLSEVLSGKKRSRVVRIFKEYAPPKLTEADELFFDSFIAGGASALLDLQSLLNDKDRLKEAQQLKSRGRHDDPFYRFRSNDARHFRQLVEQGIILPLEEGSGLVISANRKEVLDDFIGFLRRKGLVPDLDLPSNPTELNNAGDVSSD